MDFEEIGFLTLHNFQVGFNTLFGISLKQNELISLYKEIDKDEDNIISVTEWEQFYRMDFNDRVKELE
jgi:hypothetical protein